MTVKTRSRTGAPRRPDEHAVLLDEASALILPAQTPGSVDLDRVAEIVRRAEESGWWDVVMTADYVLVLASQYDSGLDEEFHLSRILERARSEGEVVWEALVLGMRATHAEKIGRPGPAADRDLARATVLLRDAEETHAMLPSAHGQCATAYLDRELWDLALEHTSAAADLLTAERDASRRATAMYNRAEIEVRRLCVRRQSGPSAELAALGESARTAIRRVPENLLPDTWYTDLHILENVVDALAPPSGPPRQPADPHGAEFASLLHLAAGFTEPDPSLARRHLMRALRSWNRKHEPELHLLTLTRDAELEALETGRETAGLRLGRELSCRRLEARAESAQSMASLIEKEQMVAEHDRLRMAAEVDELTGLANRRGLATHVAALRADRAGSPARDVIIVLVDIDHFKAVNDTHGHGVGDAVLVLVAAALGRVVRASDLAVRWGGDEFLLLLDTDNIEAARARCAEVADVIRSEDWDELSLGLRATVSIGLASGSLGALEDLRESADQALYRTKMRGRDGVSV
ncbi:GGDEF domain-containing protein [Phycicoccus sp. CSK15P-2]|uniref:GGDEF domain-containing protein n=1 Tax=Phycicoccus sp. CSK15P-2 TaxID=2807627 RepID=UPI0019518287|nr:GGDEF domain-containing protein [Phycicoccus sp. CSK15P-2]MBM6403916.1 GGDEF domain-containing protein [Phycicoccus sp. CSK15P-2]